MRTPPSEYTKQLKDIDKSLSLVWDNKIQRWWVLHRSYKGNLYKLMLIQNDDGSFREIDARTIRYLRYIFYQNRNNFNQWLYDMGESDEIAWNKADKELEDYTRNFALESRRVVQMLGRHLGYSSGKAKIPTVQGFGNGV